MTGTDWSGRGASNPRLQLGKLSYYPYTTAAFRSKSFITCRNDCHKNPCDASCGRGHPTSASNGGKHAGRQVRKPGRLACSLQRVIFFADARTLQLSHDRYRRGRTFRHRRKTQSPANGGACDACLCRALFSFSFSRLCHSRRQNYCNLRGAAQVATSEVTRRKTQNGFFSILIYKGNILSSDIFQPAWPASLECSRPLGRPMFADSQIGISGGNNSAINLPELRNLSKLLSSNRFEPNEPKLGGDGNRHKHRETFFGESRI